MNHVACVVKRSSPSLNRTSTCQNVRHSHSVPPTKQLTEPSAFVRTAQSTGADVYGSWPILPKLNSMPPDVHGPRMEMSRNLATWLK